MTKVVNVPAEKRDIVEKYAYERSSRRDIIAFMLTQNMDISSESFKAYQKEYMEFDVMFNKAKEEIEKEFVPEEYRKAGCSWTLDYETAVLTITTKD